MGKRITTEIFLERIKTRFPNLFEQNDYSNTNFINVGTKVTVKCKTHGNFEVWPGDHMNGMSGCKICIQNKRRKTNIKKYGVDNIFKRNDIIKAAMVHKYGVPNPGLLTDHVDKIKKTNLKKYGTIWGSQTKEAKTARRETNLKKYGCEFPTQNKSISDKIVRTKIDTGGFTKSNSSKEATNFIKSYIHNQSYENDQCAYANEEAGLHEWGIYKNGRWILFDLIVFEKGHRGDKDKIIEILEYHGPFHYTLEEAKEFGDKKAYPWKTNKTTIQESYLRDVEKEQIANTLTNKYTVIRTRHEKLKFCKAS